MTNSYVDAHERDAILGATARRFYALGD